MTENNELTSNEYLEMANHAKELVEQAESKMHLYKNQNIEFRISPKEKGIIINE